MTAPWKSQEPRDLPQPQIKNRKRSGKIESELYQWKKTGHQVRYLGDDIMTDTVESNLNLQHSLFSKPE